jgi:CubicO group peptidase (beta-lactamase class C family)
MKYWVMLLLLTNLSLVGQSKEDAIKSADSLTRRQANKFFNRAVVLGVSYADTDTIIPVGRINSLGRKASADDVFQLGSVTKTITTLMLAVELEKGTLALSDPIKPYLSNREKDKFDSVTLFHLATHTSGLQNNTLVVHAPSNLAAGVYGPIKNIFLNSTAHLAWRLGPWQAVFLPSPFPYYSIYGGAALNIDLNNASLKEYGQWRYSNVGMGVLGNILVEQNGTTYEDLLQSSICQPLGLDATSTQPRHFRKGTYATPHNMFGIRTIRTQFPKNGMEGAADIKMSANDMMTYLKLQLYPEGPLGNAVVLQQKTYFVSDSDEQPDLAMALGWIKVQRENKPEIFWHKGQVKGTSAFIGFIPEKKIGIFLLANNNHPKKLAKAGLWWLEQQL